MDSDSDEDFNNYSEEELINISISSGDDNVSQTTPTQKHLQVLKRSFGHKEFRPMQWSIINTALNEKRDQCIIMATGSGKSLCFQYPSVYTGECTIVISPLISLMEDQVLSLKVAGIPACFLGTAQKNSSEVIREILENKYRLIYLTPEYCTGDSGEYLFEKMRNEVKFTLIAIDEAHCISKWGHDFRSSYRSLGKIRSLLPNIPIIAVTATATEKVQKDICSALKMKNPKLQCSGFDRPNLYFEILPKGLKNVAENIRPYLAECGNGSTIIYTLTKKDAESISLLLNNQGIRCEMYHAGLSMKKRKEVHEQFTKDEIKIIVATVAFGMGIDKPDVRLVVHYGASKDVESYYQEVGRAGRDGLPAKCVTFFSKQDFVIHNFLRKSSSMNNHLEEIGQKMKSFIYSTDCRRKLILSYFTGKKVHEINVQNDFCCDNCTKKKSQPSLINSYVDVNEEGLYDFTKDCVLLLEAIEVMEGKYGLGTYIKFLKGLKINRIKDSLLSHKLYGAGSKRSEDWWKIIGRLLEEKKFLAKKKFSYAYTLELSKNGQKYLRNIENSKDLHIMKLPPPVDILPFLKRKQTFTAIVEDDDDDIPIIFNNKQPDINKDIEVIESKKSPIPSIEKITNTAPIAFTKGTLKLYDENSSKTEIEYNTKLFNELKEFRNQIAHDSDCRPYMVASDSALLEMVHLLPVTLLAFEKANFNSFNEIKLKRFGSKFVSFIQTFVQKHGTPQQSDSSNTVIEQSVPLRALLAKYPNEKMKPLNASMTQTYKMLLTGKTLSQIAEERSLALSTLGFHLTSALINGCPIKLNSLGLEPNTCRDIIQTILKQPPPINISEIRLTTMKECLPEIEYNDLRYVLKYIEIREYADSLNQQYIDHDPELYTYYKELKRIKQNSSESSSSSINNADCFSKDDLELIQVLQSLADENNEGELDDTNSLPETSSALLTSIDMSPTLSSNNKEEPLAINSKEISLSKTSNNILQASSINKITDIENDNEDVLLQAPAPPLLSSQHKRKSDDDESLLSFVTRKVSRR